MYESPSAAQQLDSRDADAYASMLPHRRGLPIPVRNRVPCATQMSTATAAAAQAVAHGGFACAMKCQ